MGLEEKAREEINRQLTASGWKVQSKDSVNLSASWGAAACEPSFATGDPSMPMEVATFTTFIFKKQKQIKQ